GTSPLTNARPRGPACRCGSAACPLRQCVDRQPDQATHQGAVDAHELQVAADVQLELACQLGSVPLIDAADDVAADVFAVALDQRRRGAQQLVVDPLL